MKICLTVDFGSTFTKISAIDLEQKKIVATAKSFTTIETDVMTGFNKGFADILGQIGKVEFFQKFASSSAAGGLKMISVGLVPDLTAKASRLAATSAGAKVIKTYSYELSIKEQEEIYEINPDIVLLSGGIDGGNKEVILHNGKMLSNIDCNFSVIVAGNKSVGDEIKEILKKSGKKTVLCENVMPVFGKLNIMPAKEAIKNLFIENIISAKGLDKAQEIMSTEIIPTPLAVYDGAMLLSCGNKGDGLGGIMAYDVGGATTDVYSMSDGMPSRPNVYVQGIREPFAKRTVEGDIGMRYSLKFLVENAGIEKIAQNANASIEEVEKWMCNCIKNPDILPDLSKNEKNIDDEFAAMAIGISANRHCGSTETSFSPLGEVLIQTGKDLTDIKYIIGSGGSVINSREPAKVLARGVYSPSDLNILKPLNPKFLLDSKNIFAAMGLISKDYPDVAMKIMKDELVSVN